MERIAALNKRGIANPGLSARDIRRRGACFPARRAFLR
jgi:hypothetical protein